MYGHGAFIVGEEASPSDRMLLGLTEEQLAAASEHRLSSTAGELLAKEAVVDWLLGVPK